MHPGSYFLSGIVGSLAHPFFFPFYVILASAIFEDAATIFVAILAADGHVPPLLALFTLFIGIIAGDLGSFGLGRIAVKHRWARWFVNHEHVQRLKPWLTKRFVLVVWTVRFIPGLRFPTYLAAGFFGMPFGKFFASAVAAVLLWTSVLFTLSYEYGTWTASVLGHYRWLIVLIPLLVAFIVGRIQLARSAASTPEER